MTTTQTPSDCTYRAERIGPDTLVTVQCDDGNASVLPHHVLHSPDGFEWGFGGSGPSDLARCILIHHLGTTDVSAALYQSFKWAVIADAPREGFSITGVEIDAWLAAAEALA